LAGRTVVLYKNGTFYASSILGHLERIGTESSVVLGSESSGLAVTTFADQIDFVFVFVSSHYR
jgi:hypothetical protein